MRVGQHRGAAESVLMDAFRARWYDGAIGGSS